MTEAEWSGCADPYAMLRFLKFNLGVRKVRLFAAACHRQQWGRRDEEVRAAVAEVERLADSRPAIEALGLPAAKADADAARYAARCALRATGADPAAQAALLRCIFGPLPFRAVRIDPAWRTAAVMALANGIYAEGRFEDMPILADALEESGCMGQDITQHLRQPGHVHVRGCWALDLLLEKR
jgi:hypothetical protein